MNLVKIGKKREYRIKREFSTDYRQNYCASWEHITSL